MLALVSCDYHVCFNVYNTHTHTHRRHAFFFFMPDFPVAIMRQFLGVLHVFVIISIHYPHAKQRLLLYYYLCCTVSPLGTYSERTILVKRLTCFPVVVVLFLCLFVSFCGFPMVLSAVIQQPDVPQKKKKKNR
jgi:hypothetical protein